MEHWAEFIVLCSRSPLASHSIYHSVCQSQTPIHPHPTPPSNPTGNHKPAVKVCESVSVLKTSSFASSFQTCTQATSHICRPLSDQFHSVRQSLGPFTLLQMALFHSFHGWIIFHCTHAPHLLYPFFCRWTPRPMPWPLQSYLSAHN